MGLGWLPRAIPGVVDTPGTLLGAADAPRVPPVGDGAPRGPLQHQRPPGRILGNNGTPVTLTGQQIGEDQLGAAQLRVHPRDGKQSLRDHHRDPPREGGTSRTLPEASTPQRPFGDVGAPETFLSPTGPLWNPRCDGPQGPSQHQRHPGHSQEQWDPSDLTGAARIPEDQPRSSAAPRTIRGEVRGGGGTRNSPWSVARPGGPQGQHWCIWGPSHWKRSAQGSFQETRASGTITETLQRRHPSKGHSQRASTTRDLTHGALVPQNLLRGRRGPMACLVVDTPGTLLGACGAPGCPPVATGPQGPSQHQRHPRAFSGQWDPSDPDWSMRIGGPTWGSAAPGDHRGGSGQWLTRNSSPLWSRWRRSPSQGRWCTWGPSHWKRGVLGDHSGKQRPQGPSQRPSQGSGTSKDTPRGHPHHRDLSGGVSTLDLLRGRRRGPYGMLVCAPVAAGPQGPSQHQRHPQAHSQEQWDPSDLTGAAVPGGTAQGAARPQGGPSERKRASRDHPRDPPREGGTSGTLQGHPTPPEPIPGTLVPPETFLELIRGDNPERAAPQEPSRAVQEAVARRNSQKKGGWAPEESPPEAVVHLGSSHWKSSAQGPFQVKQSLRDHHRDPPRGKRHLKDTPRGIIPTRDLSGALVPQRPFRGLKLPGAQPRIGGHPRNPLGAAAPGCPEWRPGPRGPRNISGILRRILRSIGTPVTLTGQLIRGDQPRAAQPRDHPGAV
ncbi:pre-mRNA 3' end processing protein WDR33-like [Homarus americanus]|uniref:pre-mRNA 3' end processing protein WDR33-like n=1 Tax=Homarus americanus TaxID=6706 RepID=UPI001C440FAB|nr:pre-mRNA 3' end processing protein WDR33-like [Homarus americanus]